MNRHAAVQLLHDRHPHVIDPPEGPIDNGQLHLDVFWFTDHVREMIGQRAEHSLKRCFKTLHTLLAEGRADVLHAVHSSCLVHIVFEEDLDWALGLMPPFLADVCRKVRAFERRSAELGS